MIQTINGKEYNIEPMANLRSADLSSADLSSANLRSANLRSADLILADLSSADLSSADLSSANLSSANLSSANLILADLRSANLILADLRSANLILADLRSANLILADLRSAVGLTQEQMNTTAVYSVPLGHVGYIVVYPQQHKSEVYQCVAGSTEPDILLTTLKDIIIRFDDNELSLGRFLKMKVFL
jgi:hypothetical protein